MKKIAVLLLLLCQFSIAATWEEENSLWKEKRHASLSKPHGWFSLIGMDWLSLGKNSIGSAPDNAIVLPHGPKYVGHFYFTNEKITFDVISGVDIFANDVKVENSIDVKMDTSGEPTVFKMGSFLFYVIERGKPALRIKDSEAQALKDFKGIDYFELSEKFKLDAEFVAYDPVKNVEIINVLGLLSNETSIGYLKFKVDDKELKLDVLDSGDDFYIMFADKTSGRTSYGPGRFMYVPKPNAGNMATLDFNRAYNPPCAFSDYSTCPLPPPQNRIPVYIKAGEKSYHR